MSHRTRTGAAHAAARTPSARRRAASRRAQIRRRRATALTGLALAVAITVLIATSAGSSSAPRADPRAQQGAGATSRHRHPSQSRKDLPAASTTSLAAEENAAIDRLLTRQPFISTGGTERREIALTFDDGPGPYTPHLLDVLHRLHVPATFFEIGFMFQWFHDSASRELRMGDVIGDHTETHPMMGELPASTQRSEIVDQTQWVRKYGGPFPRLWRPPYGSYNATTLAILHQEHMLMVLWTVDTDDYLRPGVSVIVHNALAGARPGAIILMHDAGGDRTQTIAALPPIIHALHQRGYTLVTVPRLILDDPPQHTQRLPAGLAGD
jgi:peptidoglycan/xylan/chitin deacetylase (PgdA/CDA1 family)